MKKIDLCLDNDEVYRKILHAMCITKKDIKDDFSAAISKSNKNGIYPSVWARRSDDLEKQFSNFQNVEVLHIERSKLWQIDPVFDKTTGILYLLFSAQNLKIIRNRYLKKGIRTHYSISLLLKNEHILPEHSQTSLFPIQKKDQDKEKERRLKDTQKLLGENADNVQKVVFVSVNYLNDEAIDAELLTYNYNFILCERENISELLETSFTIDNGSYDNILSEYKTAEPTEQTFVTLKEHKRSKKF